MTSKKPIQFTGGLALLCTVVFMSVFLLPKGVYYALGIGAVKVLLVTAVAGFMWRHARQRRRGMMQE